MKIQVDKSSGIPLYKQIINFVKTGLSDGSIVNGDVLPSLNELASEAGISMETAKKAYVCMKKENLISGHQGKGYSVDVREEDFPLRILLLLDKLSAYKLAIHRGLMDSLSKNAKVTIRVYNQDIELFETLVSEAVGCFDYYLVAAHFALEVNSKRVTKALGKFPNDRLILLDHNYPELKGHIGRVYQEYETDAVSALASSLDRIRKYTNVIILHTENSLYAGSIVPQIEALLTESGIRCEVSQGFKTSYLRTGTLFIVIGGQLDTDHFSILREASVEGYVFGKEIGIISYNDEPVNEFICGGLACLSSDFNAMGRSAAEMINSGQMKSIHNPFSLVIRNSF